MYHLNYRYAPWWKLCECYSTNHYPFSWECVNTSTDQDLQTLHQSFHWEGSFNKIHEIHWKNPERQDMPFTPFVLGILPGYGHCKVSIGVLFINSNSVLSSLHLDFPIVESIILSLFSHCPASLFKVTSSQAIHSYPSMYSETRNAVLLSCKYL